MGHFSKYLPRGSTRIKNVISGTTDLQYTTFKTNTSIVIVVLNTDSTPVDYQIQYGNLVAKVTIPDNGIQTLIFDQ